MNEEIKVLNAGMLRLIDSMGTDLSIIRSARTSHDAAWRTGENENSDTKLLGFLMRNKHNTPFESVTVTFEVKAPIFVFRQWHRHRTQSYNELSARYRELPAEFYIPELDQITTQHANNKQMRTSEINPNAEIMRNAIITQNKESFEIYKLMLADGCPRELARSILPVGTYSHMFATANLHNWFGFLRERLHEHAQYEIRVYAFAILSQLKLIAPVAVQAFTDQLNQMDGYNI